MVLMTIGLMGHMSNLMRYIETHFRIPIYQANYISGNLQPMFCILAGKFALRPFELNLFNMSYE